MSVIVLLVIILSAFSSQSYAAQPLCNEFEAALDDYLKLTAKTYVEGIGDNSAPRETTRLLQVNNYLQLANMNLTLLNQNKCAVRSTPISHFKYLSEAMACNLAMLERSDEKDLACDMSRWKGDVKK